MDKIGEKVRKKRLKDVFCMLIFIFALLGVHSILAPKFLIQKNFLISIIMKLKLNSNLYFIHNKENYLLKVMNESQAIICVNI